MNPRHTHTLTHFGPLFVTTLGGWMAFHFINSGTMHIVPGIIVAGLLAYAGTLVALRARTTRDLQSVYPAMRTIERFTTVATPRTLTRLSRRPAFDVIDIAAGD